jgi:hypothetical protein
MVRFKKLATQIRISISAQLDRVSILPNMGATRVAETSLNKLAMGGHEFYCKADHQAAVQWKGRTDYKVADMSLTGNKARKNIAVLGDFLQLLHDENVTEIIIATQGAVSSNYIMLMANDIAKVLEIEAPTIKRKTTILFRPFYHDRNPSRLSHMINNT